MPGDSESNARRYGPLDEDLPCSDCGKQADYVDPDSGLCDLCSAIRRAMEDTAALDEVRAGIEPRH